MFAWESVLLRCERVLFDIFNLFILNTLNDCERVSFKRAFSFESSKFLLLVALQCMHFLVLSAFLIERLGVWDGVLVGVTKEDAKEAGRGFMGVLVRWLI